MATKKIETKSEFEGKKAPKFNLLDDKNNKRSIDEFNDKYLLLYFYPKDMTPGCTRQAQNYRDNLKKLQKFDLEIIGVSCDSVARHQKFVEKEKLNFTLLSDEDKKIVEKYGVWVEKNMYGKKYMGIQRDAFLIGPDRKIIKHYKKVKPDKHVEELIKDLKELVD